MIRKIKALVEHFLTRRLAQEPPVKAAPQATAKAGNHMNKAGNPGARPQAAEPLFLDDLFHAIGALKSRADVSAQGSPTDPQILFPLSASFLGASSSLPLQMEYTPGQRIPKKGVYLGVWSPTDHSNRSIGKTFALYAAPHDLGLDEDGVGKKMTGSFDQFLDAVSEIRNLMGFKGEVYESDRELHRALRNGSYKGGWFIPTKEILVGRQDNDSDEECSLSRHHRSGVLAKTFFVSIKSPKERYYLSCTEHQQEDHIIGANLSNGSLIFDLRGRPGFSMRLVRAEILENI
jgi:hypothetical protein